MERGWLPLLCWHHLEELLQHRDDQLVDARLRYLWNWPLMAWVRPSDAEAGPGSILDVLKAEVAVAHSNPSADALQVRDLARDQRLSFGPATDAIPDDFQTGVRSAQHWLSVKNILGEYQPYRAGARLPLTTRESRT